jgi:hypothetical protein
VLHPQTSDDFDGKTLLPIWQWNHNPVPEAWSLTARRGWLRIKSRPAAALGTARNTLTQKIWDDAGVIDVKMDAGLMKDGRRAGFAFMSASHFGWIGVGQENGVRRIAWENGERPVLGGKEVWFRGVYSGDAGSFSTAWTAGPISIRGRCFAWHSGSGKARASRFSAAVRRADRRISIGSVTHTALRPKHWVLARSRSNPPGP